VPLHQTADHLLCRPLRTLVREWDRGTEMLAGSGRAEGAHALGDEIGRELELVALSREQGSEHDGLEAADVPPESPRLRTERVRVAEQPG